MPIPFSAADWAPGLVRSNPLRQWNEKEWWFAYAWDPERRFYLSWAFVRAFYGDHFGVLAVEEGNGGPVTLQRSLVLDRVAREGRLCLENAGRLDVRYADEGGRLTFRLAADGWRIELSAAPSPIPPFVRREEQFARSYSVVHTYRNPVEGTVTVGGRTHSLRTDHTYFDHCHGNVPGRTGWHWLAVQNRDTALTCLVNYGPYAQLYSHVLHGGDWLRLAQDVCFEPGAPGDGRWRVRSPELDLVVEPLARQLSQTHMPPGIPFLVNLSHAESLVRVSGRIRVEGAWREPGELVGVMEEHCGRW